MIKFFSFSGTVIEINNFLDQTVNNAGCDKLISVTDERGSVVKFLVTPDTYFVNQDMIKIGDYITGYYDGNAPAILIYPPQYTALIIAKRNDNQNVKVDFFNRQLVSSDGQLKLNISNNTKIILKNGQLFFGNPAGRNLIVVYGASTRSIPAQTTPSEIIVWCGWILGGPIPPKILFILKSKLLLIFLLLPL